MRKLFVFVCACVRVCVCCGGGVCCMTSCDLNEGMEVEVVNKRRRKPCGSTSGKSRSRIERWCNCSFQKVLKTYHNDRILKSTLTISTQCHIVITVATNIRPGAAVDRKGLGPERGNGF